MILDDCIKLIKSEIDYCSKKENQMDIKKAYAKAFICGLEQAIFLIKKQKRIYSEVGVCEKRKQPKQEKNKIIEGWVDERDKLKDMFYFDKHWGCWDTGMKDVYKRKTDNSAKKIRITIEELTDDK
jgi:hypothetical protein